MKANKCDRCGTFYTESKIVYCNQTVTKLRIQTYNNLEIKALDLCDDCTNKFVSWIMRKAELVKKENSSNE